MEYHVNSAVYKAETKTRLKKADFNQVQVDQRNWSIRADMAEVKQRQRRERIGGSQGKMQ